MHQLSLLYVVRALIFYALLGPHNILHQRFLCIYKLQGFRRTQSMNGSSWTSSYFVSGIGNAIISQKRPWTWTFGSNFQFKSRSHRWGNIEHISLCKVPQIMELVPVPVHWLEKELVPVPVPILLEGTSSFSSSFFSSIFIGRKMQKLKFCYRMGVSINILPKPKNFAKTPSKVLSEGEISPKELCKI